MELPTKKGNPNLTTESSTPSPNFIQQPQFWKVLCIPSWVTGLSVSESYAYWQTQLIKWKQWLCPPTPN